MHRSIENLYYIPRPFFFLIPFDSFSSNSLNCVSSKKKKTEIKFYFLYRKCWSLALRFRAEFTVQIARCTTWIELNWNNRKNARKKHENIFGIIVQCARSNSLASNVGLINFFFSQNWMKSKKKNQLNEWSKWNSRKSLDCCDARSKTFYFIYLYYLRAKWEAFFYWSNSSIPMTAVGQINDFFFYRKERMKWGWIKKKNNNRSNNIEQSVLTLWEIKCSELGWKRKIEYLHTTHNTHSSQQKQINVVAG